jgi:hypothetical protein
MKLPSNYGSNGRAASGSRDVAAPMAARRSPKR